MFPVARLHLKKLILWVAPLAGLACGGDGGTDVVLPSLRITTATGGLQPDPDGYSISINGQPAQPIGASATVVVNQLAEGQYTVELAGVAPNCGVEGENPRSVGVAAGPTVTVAFVITCAEGAGAVQVVTTTTGAGTDPDGFSLLLDGASLGPIGVTATSTLPGLTPGPHTVGLTGLAANCQLSGENPRPITVSAGGTAQVAFVVACSAPGPTTGSIEIVTVTTGAAQNESYAVSVDGGTGQPIGPSATITLANVSAGQHSVQLLELPSNCSVTGDNPIGVAVQQGETARVSFPVTCASTVGALRVTVAGLPSTLPAAVTVTGPNDFSQVVTETRTLEDLTPGSYDVAAVVVVGAGTTYTPSVGRTPVPVTVGATATVTVSYTPEADVTLNLRIDGLYLTQSTQTYSPSVPLVAGRNGFLRIFVVANESNSARPSVRVRLSRPGASDWIRTISAPSGPTPTEVREGTLGSSWNLPVPGAHIQSGLSIVADVDQDEDIEEANENDNRFPASGTKALAVQSVPAARIRFVSVQQGSMAAGDVSNPNQLIEQARRLHPLNAVDVDVHSTVFTATAPLQANGDGWNQLVSDLDGLRQAEGSDRTYFGIVKLPYGRNDGLVGLAFQGLPTAAGWDDPSDASRVVAHELGHTWGRRHSPCDNPPPGTVDDLYPYEGGRIGVFGLDVAERSLKTPSVPDIMGYCVNPSPWISDYTYKEVMEFRRANFVRSNVASAVPQRSLLVWGRIVNGRPVLEPSFEIVTRPSLPRRPGPYSVSATGADGSRLFTLSFDVAAVDDNPRGNGHFAFAVPLDEARTARLGSLRLQGPTGSAGNSRIMGQPRSVVSPGSIVARRQGENVSLRWDAAVHPMIMVRDPDSGEILSFARGGAAVVRTSKAQLDLDVSDGVRSQRVRLAISRS